ncbi:MAG: YbgC/FadM family acyl-CoA thioesterase [Candidatus Aureabacteria bacterium]|nr:YbgC/FadM family acyl-CoA thioesterase [Candidatus Auribacterota bacterium]
MTHHITVKVYYEDTDCGGVVYYANYLRYLERARTEYFESTGLSLKAMKARGIQFVVRHVDIEYLRPGHYGDVLRIDTDVEKIEKIRILFRNTIMQGRSGDVLARAKTSLVCIDESFRPVRIPAEIQKKILSHGKIL